MPPLFSFTESPQVWSDQLAHIVATNSLKPSFDQWLEAKGLTLYMGWGSMMADAMSNAYEHDMKDRGFA